MTKYYGYFSLGSFSCHNIQIVEHNAANIVFITVN